MVMLNFYADWCRFSQMLSPVWDELADKVNAQFPEPGRVAIGKVDCERQQDIASRFHITKYPTLKLLRNGQVVKKEYRGQRTADALAEFVAEQLKDPVVLIKSIEDVNVAKKDNKRTVFGFFESQMQEIQISNFKKLSLALKDDCKFFMGTGEPVEKLHPPGMPVVTFVGSASDEDDTFLGDLSSYPELLAWATDRCIPLVREITFANAEELTEEGLPFLILFHAPDDLESPKAFRSVVERELTDEKTNVNFLIADGIQFAHPLHHLGKDKKDLPLIAIDSFRHMYLFKDYSSMDKPGALKQFLADLYSGKLHQEFHYGPMDPPEQQTQPVERRLEVVQQKSPTTPPESTFKKLGPSPNRYTLLEKQEL
ncbi:hypothetical protein HAZT_HAZT002783 [Hyalella azteca]|uniref:Thioredoxin domain-containing protein n=1 Tax=Hyalella azteca TaxID=294128 RepID=A0A6A0GP61_HYAAZ|nr:hypothetical protein HAZT_HAZT002783 [Hyalella azteca]